MSEVYFGPKLFAAGRLCESARPRVATIPIFVHRWRFAGVTELLGSAMLCVSKAKLLSSGLHRGAAGVSERLQIRMRQQAQFSES